MLRVKDLTYQTPQSSFCYTLECASHSPLMIYGPSGIGKTTLLHLISGFYGAQSGVITLDDQDITNLSVEHRPTAYMMQGAPLFPGLSALDLVALGTKNATVETRSLKLFLRPGKDAKERAAYLLERLGFSNDDMHKKVQHLSGGERHRVALAQTLGLKRSLILLDEPFTGLDAEAKSWCFALISEVLQEQKSYLIFTSHAQEDQHHLKARLLNLGA